MHSLARWSIVAGIAVVLCACEMSQANFSQYPGFAAYFAAHPRAANLPTPGEQTLLRRYLPRYFLASGQPGPVDFYADYIAHGELRDEAGRLVSQQVTREILNAFKSNPGAVFTYRPQRGPTQPRAYGRIDKETVTVPTEAGPAAESFTFLTYNLVFAVSGLPAGLAPWKDALVRLFASPEDWHQLDHYISATIALDAWLSPVAVTLQQHNHMHTFLLGADIPLPADCRILLEVAIRSNELYPHADGRMKHRAVPMPDPATMRYLMSGERRPVLAADDLTDNHIEVAPVLAFLRPEDAFYSFQGFLGERRWPRQRDGPPGADYNTLPALKPKAMQMLAYYWRDGNPEDLARFDRTWGAGRGPVAFAQAQAPVFFGERRRIGSDRNACSATGAPSFEE
ncbi:MAG: hypothetical protein HY712_03695 [candidate division NC10 bacterium]|nr:hypothetical protein [candidate division NC10 bacterium]